MAVLASGEGTNFQAIVDHIKLGILRNVDLNLLIYDRTEAKVAERAKREGIEAYLLNIKDREEFDRELLKILKSRDIELVALAGFLRILGEEVIREYKWKIMNIHPSLLPSFGGKGMYGLKVHKNVLLSGVKVTGCTVHYVDVAVDAGPIILQKAVNIDEEIYQVFSQNPDLAVEILAKKVLKFEHRLYPKALQLHVDKRIKVESLNFEGKEINFVRIDYSNNWEKEWEERQKKYG
ncbi:Phosphoribosylglycinamide formyltransferase [archaeon HR06]|nr:Phosphoribosylglycinamide formyltransferase [archaeon HR06]